MTVRDRVTSRSPLEKAESFTLTPDFIHRLSDSEVLVLCCESTTCPLMISVIISRLLNGMRGRDYLY